jgi:hypothetical protein
VALFLTILEGDTPEKARPLIATRDKEIIRLVTVEIARRLDPTKAKTFSNSDDSMSQSQAEEKR